MPTDARVLRALVQERVAVGDEAPVGYDDLLARKNGHGIGRRDLLKRGGAIGAGLALAAYGSGSVGAAARTLVTPARPGRRTGHEPRVAVVGAGLAGLTAAHRLSQVGVNVRLFEARDRVGGRCWTSRGWVDGQTAEHGGELVNSSDYHLKQLIDELGLELVDLFKGDIFGGKDAAWLTYVDNEVVTSKWIHESQQPVIKKVIQAAKAIGSIPADPPHHHKHGKHHLGANDRAYSFGTATPAAKKMDQLSMAEWLHHNVPGVIGSPLGTYLDELIASWYGLDLNGNSALNWIDYYLIDAGGQDERWHVRGGNDQVVNLTAAGLPDGVLHMETPLEAVVKRADGTYQLRFAHGTAPYVADFVIFAMPFTTLRRVDLSKAGLSAHMTGAIQDLGMGTDGKMLLQYDEHLDRFATPHGPWSGGMDRTGPNIQTWQSSVEQAGAAGLLTLYVGGHSGAKTFGAKVVHGEAPAALVKEAVGWIDDAVPGTGGHFNGRAWVDWWTGDEWSLGSYAAFTPGQMTKYWHGTGKAEGNVHFAGEQSSTFSQGFLNGGVESGDRTAIEVMEQLGIPVPKSLSKLPYSTFN